MSIKSEPYYFAVCDRCGAKADYGDFTAMADAGQAGDYLDDQDWLTVGSRDGGEKHYCGNCTVWSDEEDELVPNFEPLVAASSDSGTE
jgi:hypothetical protein